MNKISLTTLFLLSLETCNINAFIPERIVLLNNHGERPSRDTRRKSMLRSAPRLKANTRSNNNNVSSLSSSSSSSSSPTKYVRILPRTSGRRRKQKSFEIQTAVTKFERKVTDNNSGQPIVQTVDLHSQLHFGNENYYNYYNNNLNSNGYDCVLYELLIDESMLTTTTTSDLRYISPKDDGSHLLMAPPNDANTAVQYGLTCQVDALDYSQENWFHADLTRQELLHELQKQQQQQMQQNLFNQQQQQENAPLWALASTASTTWPAGAEAVAALFRPITPATSLSSSSSSTSRRLFTNLFLPGNALTALFRSLFWVALPSPELTVMILDWSSILPRPTGGLSQVALPVLECLFSGNVQAARQLVFGQMVVSGQSSSSNNAKKDDDDVLIEKRNDKALDVLQTSLQNNHDDTNNVALLYGAMHCNDLHSKLVKQMGFTPITTEWRTAWSVTVPNFGTSTASPSAGSSSSSLLGSMAGGFEDETSPAGIGLALVILPLYLLIGGLDWISTLQEIATSIDNSNIIDGTIVIGLYLMRHVLLYLGLSKFIIDWDGAGDSNNLFGSNDE